MITPKHKPLDKVIVTAYGLNAPGQIAESVLKPNDFWCYVVEYAIDGRIAVNSFHEGDLATVQ